MKCLAFAPVLAPVFALCAGCAAQPEQKVTDAKQQTCELVYRIGSNLPVRDCSEPQTAAERQRTLDAVRDLTRNTPPAAKGG